MKEDYRERMIALIKEVTIFSNRKDVPEDVSIKATELHDEMDASLVGYPINVEDEYRIIQNWRVKFQALKNKVD